MMNKNVCLLYLADKLPAKNQLSFFSDMCVATGHNAEQAAGLSAMYAQFGLFSGKPADSEELGTLLSKSKCKNCTALVKKKAYTGFEVPINACRLCSLSNEYRNARIKDERVVLRSILDSGNYEVPSLIFPEEAFCSVVRMCGDYSLGSYPIMPFHYLLYTFLLQHMGERFTKDSLMAQFSEHMLLVGKKSCIDDFDQEEFRRATKTLIEDIYRMPLPDADAFQVSVSRLAASYYYETSRVVRPIGSGIPVQKSSSNVDAGSKKTSDESLSEPSGIDKGVGSEQTGAAVKPDSGDEQSSDTGWVLEPAEEEEAVFGSTATSMIDDKSTVKDMELPMECPFSECENTPEIGTSGESSVSLNESDSELSEDMVSWSTDIDDDIDADGDADIYTAYDECILDSFNDANTVTQDDVFHDKCEPVLDSGDVDMTVELPTVGSGEAACSDSAGYVESSDQSFFRLSSGMNGEDRVEMDPRDDAPAIRCNNVCYFGRSASRLSEAFVNKVVSIVTTDNISDFICSLSKSSWVGVEAAYVKQAKGLLIYSSSDERFYFYRYEIFGERALREYLFASEKLVISSRVLEVGCCIYGFGIEEPRIQSLIDMAYVLNKVDCESKETSIITALSGQEKPNTMCFTAFMMPLYSTIYTSLERELMERGHEKEYRNALRFYKVLYPLSNFSLVFGEAKPGFFERRFLDFEYRFSYDCALSRRGVVYSFFLEEMEKEDVLPLDSFALDVCCSLSELPYSCRKKGLFLGKFKNEIRVFFAGDLRSTGDMQQLLLDRIRYHYRQRSEGVLHCRVHCVVYG